VGGGAVAVGSVGGIKRRPVHLGDGVNHKPRQVIVGQPIADVGRE
jgi:hypothetical protein